jgi:hypothetical protein
MTWLPVSTWIALLNMRSREHRDEASDSSATLIAVSLAAGAARRNSQLTVRRPVALAVIDSRMTINTAQVIGHRMRQRYGELSRAEFTVSVCVTGFASAPRPELLGHWQRPLVSAKLFEVQLLSKCGTDFASGLAPTTDYDTGRASATHNKRPSHPTATVLPDTGRASATQRLDSDGASIHAKSWLTVGSWSNST